MKKKQVMALLLSVALASTSMLAGCGNTNTESTAVEASSNISDEDMLKNAVSSVVNTGASDAKKQETVYVKTDATGDVDTVIVSNWLKNSEYTSQLNDSTKLQNIKNVKGKEKFTQDGDTITWEADGEDIYYQGTTDKELPVEVAISYELDGNAIAPENLVGKSGHVTIHFDYVNHEKNEVEIGGNTETIYTPFAVVSGMLLDNDRFKNIEVTNGTVINDANRAVAVGIAFPGLVDSLNGGATDSEILEKIEDSLEIPSSFEVNADVENFKLGMTMTMVTSDVMSSLGLGDINTDSSSLDEYKEDVAKLGDASKQLVDGSGSLKDGAQELSDGTSGLVDGTGKLYDGVVSYTDGVGKVADGAVALDNGVGTLKEGTSKLSAGVAS